MLPVSPKSLAERELPLKIFTPEKWADCVLGDLNLLLCDHAHLEKKAALNALTLLHRRPDCTDSRVEAARFWANALTQIAEEEVSHLKLVLEHLHRRAGNLRKNHANPYATALRSLERKGQDPGDLIDRLLVSALIEARSCERFLLLSNKVEDPQLAKFFSALWSSEHGHYRTFIELACLVSHESEVFARWEEMLVMEAAIICVQAAEPRIHSWPD